MKRVVTPLNNNTEANDKKSSDLESDLPILKRRINTLEKQMSKLIESNEKLIKTIEADFEPIEEEIDEVSKKMESLQRDFISNSLQITGIISGIFAIILAVYIGLVNSSDFFSNWEPIANGACWVLAIAIFLWVGFSIYKWCKSK